MVATTYNSYLSEHKRMTIPDPDEFERSISVLLDSVDETSKLYNISHSNPSKWTRQYILIPAPLYYRYEFGEWWSINTGKRYESNIPWYRQTKNWPIYPILNDILVFEFRQKVRNSHYCTFPSEVIFLFSPTRVK